MRVLVTGSRGLVGAAVVHRLDEAGHQAAEFDLVDGQDILHPPALRESIRGCGAVVHSAALLGREGESAERIMEVNLQGTWNVLSAAADAGVRRVVFLSSVDALGVFKGERPPDYLPIDSDHPCRPTTPYGISKLLAEQMCRHTAESGGPSVVCLRSPGVWTPETYSRIEAARFERPEFEWDPFWEYGAFLDVRDLADACLHALSCEVETCRSVFVSSSDITTSDRTSRELASMVHPDVEWRGGPEYESDPYRTLLDPEPARGLLDWRPAHSWRKHRERHG